MTLAYCFSHFPLTLASVIILTGRIFHWPLWWWWLLVWELLKRIKHGMVHPGRKRA